MRAVCGLDVHKDSVYLCVLSEGGELFEKVFGVLTVQLEEMVKMMRLHHVEEVSMENTSVYWIPTGVCCRPISGCVWSIRISSGSFPAVRAT